MSMACALVVYLHFKVMYGFAYTLAMFYLINTMIIEKSFNHFIKMYNSKTVPLMKTCLLGLLFLGLTNLSFTQNDIAMETTALPDKDYTPRAVTIQNEDYLNLELITAQPLAVGIKKLQTMAANFDVTSEPVYSKNQSITYTVNFKSSENYITAIYDANSIIISSKEYYEDVRIPLKISQQLAKDYPGWAFLHSSCKVNYDQSHGASMTYEISIEKENKSKSITLTI